METNANPIMRGAIAFPIVIVPLGLFALFITPLANVLIEVIK